MYGGGEDPSMELTEQVWLSTLVEGRKEYKL